MSQPDWVVRFAKVGTTLGGLNPFVPILVENIPRYIQLKGYEQNYVKDVQTIGRIRSDTPLRLFIYSVTSGKDAKFPLNLNNLSLEQISSLRSDGSYRDKWANRSIFKVFGTLRHINGDIVLVAIRLEKVEDPIGSLKTLGMLAAFAPKKYCQYHIDTSSTFSDLFWELIKKKKRHLKCVVNTYLVGQILSREISDTGN
ncbi:uncharacterized protein LOC105703216 isoform X3 [Orussus abietinus]|uniref:uncharacterized protein LOC105703216 isoform X3 n=1 Tax=Orussus abietinus TaxID=222816 RepID=UPI00062555EB|nr:uncharacterized protein LOC105703216 isoform X3 [Orussus abietinus]